MNSNLFNTPYGDFVITFRDNGKENKIEGRAAVVEISHEPVYDDVISMYDTYNPVRFAVDNNIEMRLKLATPFTVTTTDLEANTPPVVQYVESPPVAVGRNYGRGK